MMNKSNGLYDHLKDRASIEEVLEFCNKVREAGEGDVLSALLPGEPQVANQCLIARNLNFSCEVSPSSRLVEEDGDKYYVDICYEDGREKWFMFVADPDVREKIVSVMNLPVEKVSIGRDDLEAILLPRRIGYVAEAFDAVWMHEYEAPELVELFDDQYKDEHKENY